ncbi:MAG TPA: nucleoside kinase [Anaerolineaceae bacterium]
MNETIEATAPLPTVEIHLPDGRVYCGPRGVSVEKFMQALPEWDNPPIVGAVINGELRELTYPISIESRVQPVTMSDADGARIYRRSLVFLLEIAFEDLFPDAELTVDHSVSSGGYFCQVSGRAALNQQELDAVERRMRELVREDMPLVRKQVPLEEAINYFQKKRQYDKVRLLRYRMKDHLVLYVMDGHMDYHHGYMVASTGYLKWFSLRLEDEQGFIVGFPRRHAPKELLPMPDYPKLLNTFRQYGRWLSKLGIENVGALNDAIRSGRIREIILVSEALHEQNIAEIAEQFVNQKQHPRIILIAGPSSSGKTTFSKRLAVQLLAQGVAPYALEMDNYFVDRDKTPTDENGKFDFEALDALDRARLQNDLRRLIAGEEVQLPRFDFKLGQSLPGDCMKLDGDQVIILEGIHGLNPDLLPAWSTDQTFRIYVSCLTQLNLDRYNRISTTDSRLLRRIVRDARERGYPAQVTIQRWESVRRGEKNHIFPYQENADAMFNSALVYELAAIKTVAEPLLRQVQYGIPEYIEAKRLLAFLEWFLPLDIDLIPDNSIEREFIGGSILSEFRLWDRKIQQVG